MTKRFRQALYILILATCGLLAGGCAIIDESRVHDDESDHIPWNTRAEWESQGMAIPY